ncbi:MAG: hypothetical protein RIQ53_3558 [Pseudomonadota bacterium]|jgi:uncharacterized protein (DUF924 family)
MHDDVREILDFWFGPPDDPLHRQPRPSWFQKVPAFDAQIRERFGTRVEAALAGGLDHWLATPPGVLPAPPMQPAQALILLLDQFTRNIFRDTARAFAGDERARTLAQALVDSGADRHLSGVQRQFVYLPFVHAEDLALQREGLRLFTAMGIDDPVVAGAAPWAQRHLEIIERFGRFPHRNAALGRPDTPEEAQFLTQPGSGF